MTLKAAGDLEFQQDNTDDARRGLRQTDEVVHRDWHGTEQRHDAAAFIGGGFYEVVTLTAIGLRLAHRRLRADDRLEHGYNVSRLGDRRRAAMPTLHSGKGSPESPLVIYDRSGFGPLQSLAEGAGFEPAHGRASPVYGF